MWSRNYQMTMDSKFSKAVTSVSSFLAGGKVGEMVGMDSLWTASVGAAYSLGSSPSIFDARATAGSFVEAAAVALMTRGMVHGAYATGVAVGSFLNAGLFSPEDCE